RVKFVNQLMEFEDQEEHEKEIGGDGGLPPSYESLGNSSRVKMSSSGVVGGGGTLPTTHTNETTSFPASAKKPFNRYRECLKNHAVGIGGHAVDGCGEFMPAGAEGTIDALKCAACNCHRNFHRREFEPTPDQNQSLFPHHQYLHPHHQHHQQVSPHHQHHQPVYQFYPYNRTPAGYIHVAPHQQLRPLALPSTSGGGAQSREDHEDVSNPSGDAAAAAAAAAAMMGGVGIGTSSSSKKRFRTKFTQEQKDRMLSLAERLGWRIQKQDEAVVQQFSNETGVKRHVLKVWMHNNKHTLGKKP
ncbi:hypothetical protein Ancab_026274, partial [Ancistrocladus abbreviatus]